MKPIPDIIRIDSKWIHAAGGTGLLRDYYRPIKKNGSMVIAPLRFTRQEKRVLRRKKYIAPSEWCEKNIMLPRDAAVPGQWRNSMVPYAAGIMDASFFPTVEEIGVCAAPQTAKTTIVYNCLGYATDMRPGNAMVIFPNEEDSKDNSSDRLQPMYEDSPLLRSYTTGYSDDMGAKKIKLQHMIIYMAWANSPARTANRPLPYVHIDEEEKYPPTSGKKESSPRDQAYFRTRTFSHMRKIWRTSSPNVESGNLWQFIVNDAHVVFDFWPACPYCGKRHKMVFENIKWAEGERDPKVIETTREVWYECPDCKEQWDDADRDAAVRDGKWIERKSDGSCGRELFDALETLRPLRIGFHIPAWISPFVKLWECASAFLKGQKGQPNWVNKLKDFNNGYAALPWSPTFTDRAENTILELCDERPEGRVPGTGEVACLLAGVDTQDDGFWFEIRAVGYGLDSWDSWGIRCGFVRSFEDLERVLWQDQYSDAHGNVYPVRFTLQDAMGHRTGEVYNFCMAHRGLILPSQGRQNQNAPILYTTLEYFPIDRSGRRRPIPGGLQLARIDTTYFKNLLDATLKIENGDPGAWLYHSNLRVEWARHMVSEGMNANGIWEPISSGRPNHGWDCSVQIMAAREIVGVKFWKKQEPKQINKQPPKKKERIALW